MFLKFFFLLKKELFFKCEKVTNSFDKKKKNPYAGKSFCFLWKIRFSFTHTYTQKKRSYFLTNLTSFIYGLVTRYGPQSIASASRYLLRWNNVPRTSRIVCSKIAILSQRLRIFK